ncbi:craniofacial development protein 2-like [Mytilus trossulus]|uniref:craniofacial development protein 2-like n=1 Tax=Mytilus trossulus TaxID=6551 RepID=UPI003003D4A5
MTMIQCYAPTNIADDETKRTFYEKLLSITCKTPRHDILIVLGEMNAKVGNDNLDGERVMGKHGLGTINENGELLVQFCGDNDLVIGAIDWCMRTTLDNEITGIRWTMNSFLEDLDFADDICLLSSNRNNLKNKTTRLNETAQSIGLTINEKETKLMNISSNTIQPVYLGHNIIEEVEDFTYLGSMLSNTNGTAKDIKAKICKVRYTFCQQHPIWRRRSISLKTKIRIHTCNVRSVHLYRAKCWRIIQLDMKKLFSFHNTCLRKICKIFWPNTISNKDLYQKTNQCCIETDIKTKRCRWIGHVLWKGNEDITKNALRWTPGGRRKRGRPKET